MEFQSHCSSCHHRKQRQQQRRLSVSTKLTAITAVGVALLSSDPEIGVASSFSPPQIPVSAPQSTRKRTRPSLPVFVLNNSVHQFTDDADSAHFNNNDANNAFANLGLDENPKSVSLLQEIHELHEQDVNTARASTLVLEDIGKENSPSSMIDYEWVGETNPIAISTSEPILSPEECQQIQQAAEDVWEQGQAKPRFTYQYATNKEAHVSDFFGGHHNPATLALNKALQQRLYPLIRRAFGDFLQNESPLFVYDALVIRYNATGGVGAGQPLHRDLGLVSVNIMLNPATEFNGGGTFFEDQLADNGSIITHDNKPHPKQPLKPRGQGHALLHSSQKRHAGAATTSGIRDILVLFISAVDPPPTLLAARLKQTPPNTATIDRLQRQQLATQLCPQDGEAWLYIGTTYMESTFILLQAQAAEHNTTGTTALLDQAIHCFQNAAQLTPCDARVYNNWGIALSRKASLLDPPFAHAHWQDMEEVYQRGFQLLQQSQRAGCQVEKDLDGLAKNYGLCLANQDKFRQACQVLEATAQKYDSGSDGNMDATQDVQEAHRLYSFCQQMLQKQNHQSG